MSPEKLRVYLDADCLGVRSGDFPVSEGVASEVLSLPVFLELSGEQQQVIARTRAALSPEGESRLPRSEQASKPLSP